MDWRYKAYLQRVLSVAPAGEKLHYLLQKWVTHTIPPNAVGFAASTRRHINQIEILRPHLDIPLEEARFYEFGAGWTLLGALTYYALGVDHQLVVDLRKLMRPGLVVDTAERLRNLTEVDLPRRGAIPSLNPGTWEAQLHECGIDYRAPCDARNTGLPANSLDCITSTATLEHIPAPDIPAILRECYRLLRSGGVMTHYIDYHDHYSMFSPEASRYNYLRYTDQEWKKFSPSLHFQNRLRHRDHLELFEAAGFQVLAEYPKEVTDEDLRELASIPLADRFKSYSAQELAILDAAVVLRKP